MKRWIIGVLLVLTACSQQRSTTLQERLKAHVTYLASDELEGRMTGSEGERLALEYIRTEFEKMGLGAIDSTGNYLQPFDFVFSRTASKDCQLNTTIDGQDKSAVLYRDFYPISYSASKSVSADGVFVGFGINAPDLNYNDYEDIDSLDGKIAIIETSSPDGNHPHSKYINYLDLSVKIDEATKHGAGGIIFINTDKRSDDPDTVLSRKVDPVDIPVVFLRDTSLLVNQGNGQHFHISTEIMEDERTGHNVIGAIDNGQPNTVVIGAHYDHLGYGEQGSLYTGEPAIHNGADDNASGVAELIELARTLSRDTLTDNNYVFIAFSGEELGLYGSGYFTKNPLFPLDHCTYMLNMDMVGRLDSNHTLIVNGIGTSPILDSIVPAMHVDSLTIKTSESGVGPSDHTSFYLKDIPVVHLFTGTHEDYHKPSDDADKINYPGMVTVYHYIIHLLGALDQEGKLPFTPTTDADQGKAPKFMVTLGVIPDYLYDGEGMRIDGVRSGKTADKAGIQDGDIVIQMGPVKVNDMTSYMKGLSYFRKGDTTDVTVRRGSQQLTFQVIFE